MKHAEAPTLRPPPCRTVNPRKFTKFTKFTPYCFRAAPREATDFSRRGGGDKEGGIWSFKPYFHTFAAGKKKKDMQVLTGSEFRANGELGTSADKLSESLYSALREVEDARRGKGKLLSWEDFHHEMGTP